MWLRDPVLERVNKFNPRCTEARLLGFSLKSSRYVVVDFDGRFRMVRTINRADADDRWKVVSPRDPFSALIWSQRQLNSHPREELEEKSILLRRIWRGIRLMLSHRTQIMTRGCFFFKQRDFMAHGTSDRCPGCRALISGGRAQGQHRGMTLRVRGRTKEDRGRESPSSCCSQSSG